MRLRHRVGRNERCPCGSGRKFKACHARTGAIGVEPAGERAKISAALVEVAKPVLGDEHWTRADYERVISLAVVAWNLAVLEADGADTSAVRRRIEDGGFAPVVDALVQRKRELFADDMRTILDVSVSELPDGQFYVQAASASTDAPDPIRRAAQSG